MITPSSFVKCKAKNNDYKKEAMVVSMRWKVELHHLLLQIPVC